MENIENHASRVHPFIFDLEFIGDVRNLNTCKIWEIAVYSNKRGTWFQAVVDPDPNVKNFPPPPIPELPQLTRAFLNENNAQTWESVYPAFLNWVSMMCSPNEIPVFISHNTFRADKPILEFECQRILQRMPYNWYFFDSLHYSRFMIRQTSGNYSLTGLYNSLFHESFPNAHRAEADVRACHRILEHLSSNSWLLTGPMYPAYSTSLRSIRWVGRRAEMLLTAANIHSLEELLLLLQKNTRLDFITHNIDEPTSIRKTICNLFTSEDYQTKLPIDNIENIVSTLKTLMTERPFSHSFVLKSQTTLVKR